MDLNYLKDQFKNLHPEEYNLWISPCDFIIESPNEDSTITILTPNNIFNKAINSRFINIFTDILKEKYEGPFLFVTKTSDNSKVSTMNNKTEKIHPQAEYKPLKGLKSDYTFDRFIVGPANQLAFNAAKEIANAPGKDYKQLFLYGSVGLGKTHLLQAIAHHIYNYFPKLRILYTNSEKMFNEFRAYINSKSNGTSEFKTKYRNVDIFILDDIQFIEKIPTLQEEIFHIYNDILNSDDKLMIFASDRLPKDLEKLSDRLRSRLGMGLSILINPLDMITRQSIFKKKLQERQIDIPDSFVNVILTNLFGDVREIEQVVNNIVMLKKASYSDGDIVTNILTTLLPSIQTTNTNYNFSIDIILKIIKNYFNTDEIVLNSRKPDSFYIRQFAIYFAKEFSSQSNRQLESIFHCNCSTISRSYNKLKQQIQNNDSRTTKDYNLIFRLLTERII